jgi:hypothetical protein
MAKAETNGAVVFECPCGKEVNLEPEDLGKVLRCESCDRYLRPSLRFLLMDRDLAPNLTVQCKCGHFVVQRTSATGKRAQCKVCKRHLMMPQPVIKFDSPGVLRVPKKVLKNQLRKAKQKKKKSTKMATAMESAGHAGRITLRPGEHICVNLNCGALLPPEANVCPKCGTNRRTGRLYTGSGPEGDPVGKWKQV